MDILSFMITELAFPRVACSYDDSLPYLEFITRLEHPNIIHRIPIRYYHWNDNQITMLICHGNGEDVGNGDIIDLANKFNINICMFDYVGYGLHSCENPSEGGCQQDVITVYKYLINEKGLRTENLIIYGHSLGTGIACYLAHYICIKENIKPRGLILVSPLMSAIHTVIDASLPGDIFMNYSLAPKITCRTLILHGDKDTVVPHTCGYELSKLFPNLSNFITLYGCEHDIVRNQSYYDAIINFLQSLK